MNLNKENFDFKVNHSLILTSHV